MLVQLKDNPLVEKIMENFEMGCDPEGTKIPYPFSWPKQENIPLEEPKNE